MSGPIVLLEPESLPVPQLRAEEPLHLQKTRLHARHKCGVAAPRGLTQSPNPANVRTRLLAPPMLSFPKVASSGAPTWSGGPCWYAEDDICLVRLEKHNNEYIFMYHCYIAIRIYILKANYHITYIKGSSNCDNQLFIFPLVLAHILLSLSHS